MRIRTRSVEYEAICLKQHLILPDRKGKPGEFLLIAPDGMLSIATKAEVEDEGRYEADAPPAVTAKPSRKRAKAPRGRKPAAAARDRKPSAPTRGRMPNALRADKMAEARRIIESGKSIQEAADAVSVSYGTVYSWAKANGWGA